jgi:3-oxoadipate enol-lactonase
MTTSTAARRAWRLPDYLVSGEGETTVYLLHGAYGSKEYWRYTTAILNRAGYRVVAWDAPGYGISAVPESLTVPGMAELLVRLIDATASARTVILGHSMGGMVAQKAVDLIGDRVRALVLSATAHTFNHSGPEWQAEFLRTRVAPLTAGRAISDYAPDLLRSMMGPGASSPAIDHLIHNIRLMDGRSFQTAIAAIAQYLEEDVPGRITIPSLCIAGELDNTCPATVMRRMASMMVRGEFHEMKGVGHFGWAERSDEYHQVVLEFLGRHAPPA